MFLNDNFKNYNISQLQMSGINNIPDLNTQLYGINPTISPVFTNMIPSFGGMDTFNLDPFGFNNINNNISFNNFPKIDWSKSCEAYIDRLVKNLMGCLKIQTQAPVNSNKPLNTEEAILQLNPVMQEKTRQLLAYAESKGLNVTITSGYRTPQEQAHLYATNPNAAKNSLHTYGKAIDINIANGTDADYKLLGDYAKSIGMRWGGDFKNPRSERWHFDLGWTSV